MNKFQQTKNFEHRIYFRKTILNNVVCNLLKVCFIECKYQHAFLDFLLCMFIHSNSFRLKEDENTVQSVSLLHSALL